ncbi:MAG: hypothetical protein QM767_11580 [Anaeromyxobacter sp.]
MGWRDAPVVQQKPAAAQEPGWKGAPVLSPEALAAAMPTSASQAFGLGAAQGLTFNQFDELSGKNAEVGSRLDAQRQFSEPAGLVPRALNDIPKDATQEQRDAAIKAAYSAEPRIGDGMAPTPGRLRKLYPGVPYLQALTKFKADTLAAQGFKSEQERSDAGVKAYLDPKSAEAGKALRDNIRASSDKAMADRPGAFIAGNVVGSLPFAALGGGAAGGKGVPLLTRALQAAKAGVAPGAAYGYGASESDSAGGQIRDTLMGGALGAGFGFAAPYLTAAAAAPVKAVGKFAAGRVAAAEAKALEAALAKQTEEHASLVGKYGGLRQTENKAIQALLSLEESGMLNPENAAKLAELRASGRVAEALNEAAANNLEFMGQRTPAVQAAKSAMQQSAQNAEQNVAKETARQLSGQMLKQQIGDRVKRYGMPVAGSIIGTAMGGPVGAAVGALAGAGFEAHGPRPVPDGAAPLGAEGGVRDARPH